MSRFIVRRLAWCGPRSVSIAALAGVISTAAGCSTPGEAKGDDTQGTASSAMLVSSDLVISQVYGGGGNSGGGGNLKAVYTHDYVELFNRGTQPVSLSGKAVQYAAQSSNFSSATAVALPNVTVEPGQYYLIRFHSGGTEGAALPTPDFPTTTGDILTLSNSAGKVALVQASTPLDGCGVAAAQCDPADWIDLVGYGATGQSETATTPGLSNELAASRKGGGCTDTGDNSADFLVGPPTPRNTGTALNVCASDAGVADAAPYVTADSGVDASVDGADVNVDAAPDASTNDGAAPFDASSDAAPIDAGAPAALVLLNEVRMNPPGATDSPWEYIEVLCTPNASLDDWYFVAFEGDGDSSGPPGTADFVVDLSGVTCGANGIVYVKAATGGAAAQSAQSKVVTSSFLDTGPSPLENATTTFALVKSPNAAVVQGADYDNNDDGTLELPAGASLVDGVATFDQSPSVTDRTYAPRLTQPGGAADGATRFPGDTTPLSLAAWYSGDLLPSAVSSLDYDGTNVSANYPIDGVLTPGAPNMGTKGTSGVIDGGVTLVDAGAKDSGIVDSGSKPKESGPPAEAGPSPDPKPDAGVKPAGAAGNVADASSDAARDASFDDSYPPSVTGCACQVPASPLANEAGSMLGAMGVALAAAMRRLRRRR